MGCCVSWRRKESAKSRTFGKKEGSVDNSTDNANESPHNNSVEETNKRRRKAENVEMASLKGNLRPGLYWLPPFSPGRPTTAIAKNLGGPMNHRQTLRLRYATNNELIVKDRYRCWDDDNHATNMGSRSVLQPTHYSSVPKHLSVVANQVKGELLRRFLPGWNGVHNFVLGHFDSYNSYQYLLDKI